MNLLGQLLSVSLMMFLIAQTVLLHKGTVCRQKAWLLSLELETESLLAEPPSQRKWHAGCGISARRDEGKVFWSKLLSSQGTVFALHLRGKL